MRAILLAAGRGSRMGEHTAHHPKCMVNLHGRPLLEYQLHALTKAGIHDIAIVRGYQKEKIKHATINYYFDNPVWQESNMVYSLHQADAWLSSTPCIVSYTDIFYQSNAITLLIQNLAPLAILYDVNFKALWSARFLDPLPDLETFQFDSNQVLTEIGDRPKQWQEIQGQYMGLLKFTPESWQQIKSITNAMTSENIRKLDMTSLLKLVIAAKYPITTVPYHGRWGEVDQASDLQLYHQHTSLMDFIG